MHFDYETRLKLAKPFLITFMVITGGLLFWFAAQLASPGFYHQWGLVDSSSYSQVHWDTYQGQSLWIRFQEGVSFVVNKILNS